MTAPEKRPTGFSLCLPYQGFLNRPPNGFFSAARDDSSCDSTCFRFLIESSPQLLQCRDPVLNRRMRGKQTHDPTSAT